MPLPSSFGNNLLTSATSLSAGNILRAAPSFIGGAQMLKWMYDSDNFTATQMTGALAQIVAESTQFKGRFLSDIFILLFTRPSPLAQSLGGTALAVGAAAATTLAGNTPLINGVRLSNATSLLPNLFAFVFRLNPTVHQRTTNRVRATTLTKGGYLTQYWSSGMKVMTFTGSSGPLTPPERNIDKENFNIRLTAQYANFLQLRKFYEGANQDVALFFLGRFLQGVLTGFDFTEDADDPYQIKYSFKFEAYPEQNELV